MNLCNKISDINDSLQSAMYATMLAAGLLGGAKVGLAVSPRATVIKFDDTRATGDYGRLAPEYDGLDWTSVYWGLNPAFVQQSLASSDDRFPFHMHAHSSAASRHSRKLFNFVGADFTGRASSNLNRLVHRSRRGAIVRSQTNSLIENVALESNDSSFSGIDRVEFVAPQGANNWFATEDFTFNEDAPKNEAPLPSGALALAVCGAVLTFVRRQR